MGSNLWFTYYSNLRSHIVTKASGHGQSWNIFSLQPYTIRPHLFPLQISKRFDPSSTINNSSMFIIIIRFLIDREWFTDKSIAFLCCNDSPRIPYIATPNCVTWYVETNSCWTTEVNINFTFHKVLLSLKETCS